jgi:tetratricopeptide (TPR) repeat protein
MTAITLQESDDFKCLVDDLRRQRATDACYRIVLGAGCSRSGGIPLASEIIEMVEKEYPTDLTQIMPSERKDYGKVLACITPADRRKLIRKITKSGKLNWGHIALAQLIKNHYIDCVLSLNFDQLPEKAAALLSVDVAIYDFGTAPSPKTGLIAKPAIIHLHGQGHGFVIHNTQDETDEHLAELDPLLSETLNNHGLIVAGYSGASDGVADFIVNRYCDESGGGEHRLYWVNWSTDYSVNIAPLFQEKSHAHYIGGADFDIFMISLCKALDIWPPAIIDSPLEHLLMVFDDVAEYPKALAAGNDLDHGFVIKKHLNDVLSVWKKISVEPERPIVCVGNGETSIQLQSNGAESSLPVENEKIWWALVETAMERAEKINDPAELQSPDIWNDIDECFIKALKNDPDNAKLLNNWGAVLFTRAQKLTANELRKIAEPIWSIAANKFKESIKLNPNLGGTLINLARVLLIIDEATRNGAVIDEAIEALERAKKLMPHAWEAFFNCGLAYMRKAMQMGTAQLDFYERAASDFRTANNLKESYESLTNLGAMLSIIAQMKQGDERFAIYQESDEIFQRAKSLNPERSLHRKNWATMLRSWALTLADMATTGPSSDAMRMFALAEQKHEKSLRICPEDIGAFSNWCGVLSDKAARQSPEEAIVTLQGCSDRLEEILNDNPTLYYAWSNWGVVLDEIARRQTGDAPLKTWDAAASKFVKALEIEPCCYQAYFNWGEMLLAKSEQLPFPDSLTVLDEATAKFLAAHPSYENDKAMFDSLHQALLAIKTRRDEIQKAFLEKHPPPFMPQRETSYEE